MVLYNAFMAKRSQYICQQCGYSQIGWSGRCPNCDSWGTLVEQIIDTSVKKTGKKIQSDQIKTPKTLSSISAKSTKRISSGITEMDNLLGGGFVPGQVVLLAGEPGIGKSTILLQISVKLGKVLYVSGEESVSQIKTRANRLNINSEGILLLEETNVDYIIQSATQALNSRLKPKLLIIDSIQTIYTNDLSGMAGSIGQVRECAYRLTQFAKKNSLPTVIVGHITKEGSIAGPATLAHIVDTVCWFEGEKEQNLRLIRSLKNRFGPTDEIGLFNMADTGLIPINESENLFFTNELNSIPGSVATCLMEGTRPVIIEVQALVNPTKLPYPKRIAQGIDPKRIEVILAVLIKHAKLNLFDKDVFVNIVGGIKIHEPAADLGIALAIASSAQNKPIRAKTLALGELGLLGEVRPVIAQQKRIKHARRHGFTNILSSNNINNLSTNYSFIYSSRK